jgi:hypothetical protein
LFFPFVFFPFEKCPIDRRRLSPDLPAADAHYSIESASSHFLKEAGMLKAKMKELLNIEYPILQGGMKINRDGYLDVIIGENVPVVETAGNNPESVINRLKAAGVQGVHKCTTVRHTLKAEVLGGDQCSRNFF